MDSAGWTVRNDRAKRQRSASTRNISAGRKNASRHIWHNNISSKRLSGCCWRCIIYSNNRRIPRSSNENWCNRRRNCSGYKQAKRQRENHDSYIDGPLWNWWYFLWHGRGNHSLLSATYTSVRSGRLWYSDCSCGNTSWSRCWSFRLYSEPFCYRYSIWICRCFSRTGYSA